MLKNIILIVSIFFSLTFAQIINAHKFYAGLTTIQINSNTQSLEIVHQLFVDDLDRVLRMREKSQAPIIVKDRLNHAEKLIEDYLKQHFTVQDSANNDLPLTFIGIEFDVSKIWIYQEVQPFTQTLKGLSIYNSLLINEFDQQINTVVLGQGENKETMIFDQRKPALQKSTLSKAVSQQPNLAIIAP